MAMTAIAAAISAMPAAMSFRDAAGAHAVDP
jgi:hypothetical protein